MQTFYDAGEYWTILGYTLIDYAFVLIASPLLNAVSNETYNKVAE